MRLHLVDGTYELFRAFYSKRPEHTAPDGREVKATVGVMTNMLNLLEDPKEKVTHLAIAYDNPIESFRNELFDGYKTGAGIEPTLREQFDLVEIATAALGIVVWSMERWEADDALATAAARWRDDVDEVRILTPDKDLGQSLVGTKVVQVDQVRNRVIDEAAMTARRGVAPASIPDFLGLVGDTADGIPGIKGFGEKTAGALLGHYGTIEAIPERARDWEVEVRGAERLAQTLAAEKEQALLYKKLDDLEWRGVPRQRFEAVCDELGANALRSRPKRWL